MDCDRLAFGCAGHLAAAEVDAHQLAAEFLDGDFPGRALDVH
jgi:hypothetical protein